MEYFKHDINASEDDKICELLAQEGYEMLGYYWRFIEYLYSRDGKLPKAKINSVAWALHMDISKLNHLIYDFGLFHEVDDCIISKRVLMEVENFAETGRRMAEIGRKGGQASAKARGQAYAEARDLADGEADGQQNKKKKIKENKENKNCALSGDDDTEFLVHPNSGELYKVVDGVMYNKKGKRLNEAGYIDIDFGLSKGGNW